MASSASAPAPASGSGSVSRWPAPHQHQHHQHQHQHQHVTYHSQQQQPQHQQQHHLPPPPPLPEAASHSSVLAARGRKRKRLQKACTACHRAKRRCDGGLPCSNCDFSGRLCSYGEGSTATKPDTAELHQHQHQHQHEQQPAAPQQHHMAPTAYFPPPLTHNFTRDYRPSQAPPMPSPLANGSLPLPPSQVPMSSGFHFHPPGPAHIGTATALNNLPSPTHLASPHSPSKSERKELISAFFNRVHPYSALHDEMTFLRELATGDSPIQLWPMYALAARFLPSAPNMPAQLAGEVYAVQTRQLVQAEDGAGSSLTLDRAYLEYLDRPDPATAAHLLAITQTVLLLSAYELGAGRHQAAMQHSSACIRLLIGAGLHRSSSSLSGMLGPQNELVRSRLVSVAFTHDVILAAMADQSATVRRFDFELAAFTGAFEPESSYRRSNGTEVSPRHRRPSDLDRSSTERLTVQLDSLARAAGIFAHALELRKQQGAYASEPALVASAARISLPDEINRQLCEWSDRLEPAQTFNGDNVQRHSSALWLSSLNDGSTSSKEWTADHSVSLCWAMMHTLSECSSVLAKSADMVGLRSARSNLVLLLENMHSVGRNSVLSLLPLLYAQQVGHSLDHQHQLGHQHRSPVDSWLASSLSSLWVMNPLQTRKAVMVLQQPTVAVPVGSSYRVPYNNSAARSPLSRSLPPVMMSSSSVVTNNSNNDGTARPVLAGTKRTYSAASATSSTSPHLHSLGSPPMSSSRSSPGTTPAMGATVVAAAGTGSILDRSASSSSTSSSAASSTVSSAASCTSSEGRSPPPPPPVLLVSSAGSGAGAIFKTNTLPPLISFHHKHRA
ncbi:hypothetical protein CF336_g2221 [Tilletia laevis]|uniref:Zn(2)-C6 fungal-type domain-containing protein n=2 Tax=Tilletia TaxID=13289 RepID=A0A177UJE5_9BASI|nr:hypothetical protein CF336_g2221 [Tilletia laevis]KAE8203235.1 hypothetical protein CF335_g3109 [Tilletia laevis]KAE8259776.1 hypothetical protein A4X03_0g3991 [Tilletia caries]CAD6906123.1 unnamed protein product [Tilletia caries]CAD7059863.1 unnamed protein product [Tilletia caries]